VVFYFLIEKRYTVLLGYISPESSLVGKARLIWRIKWSNIATNLIGE